MGHDIRVMGRSRLGAAGGRTPFCAGYGGGAAQYERARNHKHHHSAHDGGGDTLGRPAYWTLFLMQSVLEDEGGDLVFTYARTPLYWGLIRQGRIFGLYTLLSGGS